MSDINPCKTDPQISTIANALQALGAKQLTGDQGSYTGYSIDEAIKAIEFQRKDRLRNKAALASALRTISGIRLAPPDGPGS